MVVAIFAALLDKDGLIDAGILESSECAAQLIGCTDAVGSSTEHLGADLIAHGLEGRPTVRPPGSMFAKDVVMGEGKLEEAEAVGPSTAGFLRIVVAREAGDHGDIRIHRVADRHALALEGLVVVLDPGLGL